MCNFAIQRRTKSFFANMGTMENIAFKEKDTDFVYLSDLAEFRAMTIPEQDNYIRTIDREVVYNNVLDRKYRFGFEDGRSQGMAQGMAQGMVQGIKTKEREMIIAMLLNGLSIETVANISKLPVEEIKKIQTSMSES